MQDISINKDKVVFINLLLVIIFFVLISIIILLLFIYKSDLNLYRLIAKFIVAIIMFISIFLIYIALQLIKIVKNNIKQSDLSVKFVYKSFRIIYPIMMLLSNIFKIDKDQIRRVFSQINNKVVESYSIKINTDDILILAPHCLQNHMCKHKITGKTYNCHRCGACNIHDLIMINDKYSTNLEIVSGGTLARKKIKEYSPKGIIAIACERDLTSGILDVKYIPVIGITNKRPEGPCHNTCVDINEVEKAIMLFLGGK